MLQESCREPILMMWFWMNCHRQVVSLINDYPPNIFTNTVNLSLNSVDDLSGTDDMQVANNPDFTGAQWQPYTATLSWSVGNSIGLLDDHARYRDRADNLSATYQVTATLPPLYIPIPSIFWQNVVFLQQNAAGVSLIFDMPLLDGVVEVQISSQPTFNICSVATFGYNTPTIRTV